MNSTYVALALIVTFSIFCRIRSLLFTLILIAAWFAYDHQLITEVGLMALTAVGIMTYSAYHIKNGAFQNLILVVLAVLVSELVLHNVSGFNNPLIYNKAFISQLSNKYSMFFNVDKIFTALIFYVCSHLVIVEKPLDQKSFVKSMQILFVCILVILVPAILAGYVKFDPKVPPIWPMWMINNFLFISFTEEVIFRGFFQNTIIHWLPKKKHNTILAIILTSIIYGLFHYRDGQTFMILSGIAGLFYGYTYLKTKRILCATLVHFLLNFTHFVLFSYPATNQ